MYTFSKYNHIYYYKNGKYCYNFLSGDLINLKKWGKKYQDIILNAIPIELWKDNYPELFEVLRESGFIYNSSLVNEYDIIKLRNRKDVFVSGNFRLTILPTLDCNFNCWYCYENHTKGAINKRVQNNIVKFIKKKINNKEINSLELDWFGGEPLLCFNDVIYPLSKQLIKLTQNSNIKFQNQITTNGYLLDKNILNKLNDIKLTKYQITLDGNKETHNKIKKHCNVHPTFDVTVDNIISLCENIDNVHVNLRINYTKDSLTNIVGIIPYFPKSIRGKMNVVFQEVWQVIGNNDDVHASVQSVAKQFIKEGFKSNVISFQIGTGFHCYADRWNEIVISTDGSVFKCTARDFANKDFSDGELNDNGEIIWNEKIYKRFSKATFENPLCSDCEFLPLCLGPCSQKIIELKDDNDISKLCNKENMKKSVNSFIENYIDNLNISTK